MSADAAPLPPTDRMTNWGRLSMRVFAVLGALGLVAIVAIVVLIFSFNRRTYRPPAKVQAANATQVFTVGDVAGIPGSTLVRMDVRASDASGGSYSGSREDQRNVIFLDTATGKSRRLLPDNDRRIERFALLPGDENGDTLTMITDATSGERTVVPHWYYMLVDQPGGSATQDLLVGDIASGRQDYILRGIDGIDSTLVQDATHLAFVLRDRRKLSYQVVDMTNFKITASHPIAID